MVHTVLPFLVHELALNPDIQLKLYKELSNVCRNQSTDRLTLTDLHDLKYMDMVIDETLRRWSPIQFSRKYMKSFYTTEIRDVKVDPNFIELNVGDSIWIPTQAIHMDEQYFTNPDIFDPQRFDEKNSHQLKTEAFFPFGTEKGRHP